MNSQSTSHTTAHKPQHCQYRFPSKRCCRLPIYDQVSGFCYKHSADLRELRDAGDLSSALPQNLAKLKYAEPINEFLARLLLFLAQDRISPRRAAVMAYTCNLLLRTIPAIDRDNDLELTPDACEPSGTPPAPPAPPTPASIQ
jgi:hypothetical protein